VFVYVYKGLEETSGAGYENKVEPVVHVDEINLFCNDYCLERGPLSLVSTTEELLDRKVAQKLAITSPTIGGRSVGIVRSRTQTMDFNYYLQFI
jgi:hypothetical protein